MKCFINNLENLTREIFFARDHEIHKGFIVGFGDQYDITYVVSDYQDAELVTVPVISCYNNRADAIIAHEKILCEENAHLREELAKERARYQKLLKESSEKLVEQTIKASVADANAAN